jgi:hypothetical protein
VRVDILLSIDQFIFGIDCGCASAGWRLHEDSHAPRQSRFRVMPLSARPCSSAANARRVKIGVWRSATEHAIRGSADWAQAHTGQTAALPARAMKERRFTVIPAAQGFSFRCRSSKQKS